MAHGDETSGLDRGPEIAGAHVRLVRHRGRQARCRESLEHNSVRRRDDTAPGFLPRFLPNPLPLVCRRPGQLAWFLTRERERPGALRSVPCSMTAKNLARGTVKCDGYHPTTRGGALAESHDTCTGVDGERSTRAAPFSVDRQPWPADQQQPSSADESEGSGGQQEGLFSRDQGQNLAIVDPSSLLSAPRLRVSEKTTCRKPNLRELFFSASR